ncbi:MAG: PASTA domain-containing protein [Bacteroidales bacterium]|jgi:beta-lactam-binding protein with PASTA domain|nr:PASTA domain-containing protein [Bacteroidales bacterium]
MATVNKKKSKAKKNSRNTNWLLWDLLKLAAALALTIFLIFFSLKIITRHNEEFELPSFVNMQLADAGVLANKLHLKLEVTDSVYIPRLRPGIITRQLPAAGNKVKKNRRIILNINAFVPKKVKMPSLVGFSLRQAAAELASAQLKVGKLIYVHDIATNNVLEQYYYGHPVAPGTPVNYFGKIDLELGMNAKDSTTTVPCLSNIPYAKIKQRLIEASLNMGKIFFDKTVKNYNDSLKARVIRQIPDTTSGPVRLGTEITLYFSGKTSNK